MPRKVEKKRETSNQRRVLHRNERVIQYTRIRRKRTLGQVEAIRILSTWCWMRPGTSNRCPTSRYRRRHARLSPPTKEQCTIPRWWNSVTRVLDATFRFSLPTPQASLAPGRMRAGGCSFSSAFRPCPCSYDRTRCVDASRTARRCSHPASRSDGRRSSLHPCPVARWSFHARTHVRIHRNAFPTLCSAPRLVPPALSHVLSLSEGRGVWSSCGFHLVPIRCMVGWVGRISKHTTTATWMGSVQRTCDWWCWDAEPWDVH